MNRRDERLEVAEKLREFKRECNLDPFGPEFVEAIHQAANLLSHIEAEAGILHPVDQAFYDLAIKERDYERVKCDRLERERDEAQAALNKDAGSNE